MKKRMLLLIGFLALMIVPVLSRDVEPPTDILGFLIGLQVFLGSFGGVAVSVPVLAAIIIGLVKAEGKVFKYVLTGLVSLALVLAAYFLPFGYLNEAPIWFVPLHTVGLLLIAVVGFAIPFVKSILEAIQDKFTKPTS